jgi:hypothetical protein
VVGDGIGGYSVNTVKEFYQKMMLLYKDAELRRRLGEGGRAYTINSFDYKTVSNASLNLISKENLTLTNQISFYNEHLRKSYSQSTRPFLWMKMHLPENKLLNAFLRMLVNFKWKR